MVKSIFYFLDEPLADEKYLQGLGDGRHQVKVAPGGAKILVHIVDGTVSSYEAEDDAGNQLPLVFIKERRPVSSNEKFSDSFIYEEVCYTCAAGDSGDWHCYQYGCPPVRLM